MYMAKTKVLRWRPNATYIPFARVGGKANFMFRVGGNTNFSVFRYQHVGIFNGKFRVGRTPNTRDFALQWNIGFTHNSVFLFFFGLLYDRIISM